MMMMCCVVWEALTLLQIWNIGCCEHSRALPARLSGKDRPKQSEVLGKLRGDEKLGQSVTAAKGKKLGIWAEFCLISYFESCIVKKSW